MHSASLAFVPSVTGHAAPRTVDIVAATQSHRSTCVARAPVARAFPAAAAWPEDAGLDDEKVDRFFLRGRCIVDLGEG